MNALHQAGEVAYELANPVSQAWHHPLFYQAAGPALRPGILSPCMAGAVPMRGERGTDG
jgi:hypothetical protein